MSAPSPNLPAALARTLHQVRQRHLAMKFAEFPIYLVMGIAAAWTVQSLADRVFHLPWAARLVLLLLDIAGIGYLLWRFVMKPYQQRLDQNGAALLVERGIPEFRTSLISAVELSQPKADILPQSRLLVSRLVEDVTARTQTMEIVKSVVRPDELKRLSKWLTGAIAIAAAVFLIGWPVSGLLIKRIFLSQEALPTQTQVVSVTQDVLVDEGGEVVLSARANGFIPPDGKLVVMRSGQAPESIPIMSSATAAGEFSQIVRNVREPFRYRFELNDGVGMEHTVSVHYPPVLQDLRFVQVYPDYTKLPEAEMNPTALKLVEGSVLRIEGKSSKPLHYGTVNIKGVGEPISLSFMPHDDGSSFHIDLPVPGTGWKTLSIHLKGRENDDSLKDAVYPVQLLTDRAPVIAISEPKKDISSVVSNDVVRVACDVTDDFGLTSVSLCYRVMRPLPDGSFDEGQPGKIRFTIEQGDRAPKLLMKWNLARLLPPITTGNNIIFWVEAVDNNAFGGPATGRSAERTMRVVSEAEKRMELLEEIRLKAEGIDQLYDDARKIDDRLR